MMGEPQRLSDISVDDVRDTDFESVGSEKQIFLSPGTPRGSVRLVAGKLVGIEDLNQKRKELSSFFDKYFKNKSA